MRKRKKAWLFKDQLWPAEGQHVSVSRTKQNKTKQTTSNGQRPFLGDRCGTDFCSALLQPL